MSDMEYKNGALHINKLSIEDNEHYAIDDIENRHEILLDSSSRIISYRKDDGSLVENAGITSEKVSTKKLLNVESINNVNISDITGFKGSVIYPKEVDLPKYGYVNIETELLYVDSSSNSYSPSKITKLDGLYWVTSTLTKIIDPETGKVIGYETNENSVQINITENDIDISTWPATTKTKHYCKVDIDFGDYLNDSFYIEVKFQGDSTIVNPKKNLRFTFYNDILFTKKKNVKIGELIETKKYNLKAYWSDRSLIREHTIYRAIKEILESRDYDEQYPWNSDYPVFTGSTGIATGFPCRVDICGEFYGVNWFGLAKDLINFRLDDETMNGILIQGTNPGNEDPTYWTVLDVNDWEDLMADVEHEINEKALPYVQDFYHYINSENGYTFNKETAHTHMNVKNWIDAVIILQFFNCVDSLAKNMILYAKEDSSVFSPMYYDMDLTMCVTSANGNLYSAKYTPGSPYADDRSVWVNFKDLFWNEICNRYKELRKTYLTTEYFQNLIQGLSSQINYSDYEKEVEKWGVHGSGTIQQHINWIKSRINYLDNYFSLK